MHKIDRNLRPGTHTYVVSCIHAYIPSGPVYPSLHVQSISSSLPCGDQVKDGQAPMHCADSSAALYFPALKKTKNCECMTTVRRTVQCKMHILTKHTHTRVQNIATARKYLRENMQTHLLDRECKGHPQGQSILHHNFRCKRLMPPILVGMSILQRERVARENMHFVFEEDVCI